MTIFILCINGFLLTWLIFSQFIELEVNQASWNNIIAGILVIIFAIITRKLLKKSGNL